MTGGGSAGHITPILSVATELVKQQPNADIRYVGQIGDPLNSLVTEEHGIQKNYKICAGKWRRYHGVGFWAHLADWRTMLKNARDMVLFGIGFLQSLWLLLRWRPNVVFVKGGYVGLPVGLAAALVRVPIVTHDSDSLPGLTNRVLSRFAAKQCVALPAEYYTQYNKAKLVHTGVPYSEDKYYELSDKQIESLKLKLQLPKTAQVLSVFGGSLGAVRINNALLEAVPALLETFPDLHVLHVTGQNQSAEITSAYGSLAPELSARVWSWPFLPNLNEITGVADVVIARAGATSIAELGQQKKAVIAVPNPYLVGGHQTQNARILQQNDAALVVSEKQLDDPSYNFAKTIVDLLQSKSRKQELGANLHALSIPHAAGKIAEVLRGVAA